MTNGVQSNFLIHGVRRLAGAILIGALEDMESSTASRRDSALQWVSGKTTAAFSFDLCCVLIGYDPDTLRRRILSAQKAQTLVLPRRVAARRELREDPVKRAGAA